MRCVWPGPDPFGETAGVPLLVVTTLIVWKLSCGCLPHSRLCFSSNAAPVVLMTTEVESLSDDAKAYHACSHAGLSC